MLLYEKEGYVIFYIVVLPNASQTCVTGVTSKYDKMVFKMHVNVAPQKGKANKEIIRYLSAVLGLGKNHIVIDQGETEKFKKIKVLNSKLDEVKKAFQALGFFV